jgi:hypothetical protein
MNNSDPLGTVLNYLSLRQAFLSTTNTYTRLDMQFNPILRTIALPYNLIALWRLHQFHFYPIEKTPK